MLTEVTFTHFHLFCGLGGGAKGFNKGTARVGNLAAKWRCLGGIDVDEAAIRDFDRLAGVKGTVMDLFTAEQYRAFHGKEPPPGWRQAIPDDIRRAAGYERPNAVFLSSPCKGLSGLLPEKTSKSPRYVALNELTLRGIWLMLEAWQDDPPELVVFENVPRIANRGRHLLDQIVALLRHYGYAVAETVHDCGVIGGLAQSRKRFLLVARHAEKVPPFLYEPPKRPLKAVGEVLEKLPMPGPDLILPMHRMPALQWKTWVRLAFVEAGSDWRSLNKLAVEDGSLRDYGIAADVDWHGGVLGVNRWDEPVGVVTGRSSPTTGAHSIADPRIEGHPKSVQLGVKPWDKPIGVVKGDMSVGTGPYAVSDPRLEGRPRFNNVFRIVPWGEHSPAVAGPGGPASGLAVADPRPSPRDDYKQTKYRVTAYDEPAGTVIAASTTGNGAFAVADPRTGFRPNSHRNKLNVVGWEKNAGTVTGSNRVGSGALSVADPRPGRDLRHGAHGVHAWGDSTGTIAGESLPPNGAFSVADPRPGFGPDTHHNILKVTEWDKHAGTITGSMHPSGGAASVADPRPEAFKGGREHYKTGGHYGVQRWDQPSGAVPAFAKNNNGNWSVADPRQPDAIGYTAAALPKPDDRLVALIRALDGTWHRPFTTLELGCIQTIVDPEEIIELDGLSDSAWRERIGNAVPPDAAQAIAGVCGRTLLLAMTGETFMLSAEPIWVRQIAAALTIRTEAP